MQPKWKVIGQIGDASPLDCGGFWILQDETGNYPEEAEVLFLDNDDDENTTYTVYRFILDKCTYTNGILSDNEFHPDHPAWFADKIDSVADYADWRPEALIEAICSDDALLRAQAYQDLAGYFGYHEFDNYPLTLTTREAKQRYGKKSIYAAAK